MEMRSNIIKLMKNREYLYRFLSKVYIKEIDRAFLDNMKAMSFPDMQMEPDLVEGYKEIEEYLENINEDSINELAADYARTFLGAGLSNGSAAFPYESVYTSKDRIVMQDAWADVCEIYTSCGLSKGSVNSDILEDHIALELEFMAFLCNKSAEDIDDIKALRMQSDFLDNHLLNWVADLCQAIEEYADTKFYKGIAKLTKGFLKLDRRALDKVIDIVVEKNGSRSYSLSTEKMDEILKQLKKNYRVYGPKRFEKRGAKGDSDLVRFAEIDSVKDMVLDVQSDFSPKEIYYPISQTMIHFENSYSSESVLKEEKDIIIFARPCDINGIESLDKIFLENGGFSDIYYKRLRDRVKFFLIECAEGFEDCFCVSMGSNKTDDYSVAVRLGEENILLEVKDDEFYHLFKEEKSADFAPMFVEANQKVVKLPKIENSEELKKAYNLEFWKSYDEKCIGCGACCTVCGTCSCFDTVDIIYSDTSREGERKRVWSSCMLDTFTQTAGGKRFRETNGENMRFRTLHKVYDFKKRFGTDRHMCVGCGRCDMRCPQDISFSDTINTFSEEMEQ
jgi:anaerobic sulfite reductase subunit A